MGERKRTHPKDNHSLLPISRSLAGPSLKAKHKETTDLRAAVQANGCQVRQVGEPVFHMFFRPMDNCVLEANQLHNKFDGPIDIRSLAHFSISKWPNNDHTSSPQSHPFSRPLQHMKVTSGCRAPETQDALY